MKADMHHKPHHGLTTTQRKQQLLAEGAVYRANILASKEEVSESLQVEALAKSAAGVLGRAAWAAWQARGGLLGASAGNLLPVAARLLGSFSQSRQFKPVLKSTLIAGVIAGIVVMIKRGRKKTTQAADDYEL